MEEMADFGGNSKNWSGINHILYVIELCLFGDVKMIIKLLK